jgi:hypothetical protein
MTTECGKPDATEILMQAWSKLLAYPAVREQTVAHAEFSVGVLSNVLGGLTKYLESNRENFSDMLISIFDSFFAIHDTLSNQSNDEWYQREASEKLVANVFSFIKTKKVPYLIVRELLKIIRGFLNAKAILVLESGPIKLLCQNLSWLGELFCSCGDYLLQVILIEIWSILVRSFASTNSSLLTPFYANFSSKAKMKCVS